MKFILKTLQASNVFSTVEDNDDPPVHAKHEIHEDPNKQQRTTLDYKIGT